MNDFGGKWPGIVKAYDGDARTVRVEIPGLTDGAAEFPVATICYPIGDKPEHTEIEILVGDKVWVEFERAVDGGHDIRFPIVVGWRTPRAGCSQGWRRIHHANVQTQFDDQCLVTGKSGHVNMTGAGAAIEIQAKDSVDVHVGSASVAVRPGSITLTVGGSSVEISEGGITMNAPVINLN